MNPIRTNKPVFFADDGEPLASGYIYVGMPGQDPRNFPKTVKFEDSGGSQFTAAQPMRTNSKGQIVYNGMAIIALVEGDYSLLILDRNMVQLKDGWTPTVSNTTASGGGGGTVTTGGVLTGVTLAEIKLLDVEPGDIVVNAGKLTATDALGAEWLAVAATGTTGDDVDLIDFSNGRQGRRIKNQVYRKDIIGAGTFLFNTPLVAVSGNWTGYTNAWGYVPLASVPSNAISAIVRIAIEGTYSTGGIIQISGYARKVGTGAADGAATKIGYSVNQNSGTVSTGFVSEVTVPMDLIGAKGFDLRINSITADSLLILNVTLVGYTIEPRTVI